MANITIVFNVTGRYMDGVKTVGYQLVGQDGSQLKVSVERVIFMIGRGEVANMRLQSNNGTKVPRGKGINLQKLPVFDINKQAVRRKEQSQHNKQSKSSLLGQQEIVAKIVRWGRIEGYVLRDFHGTERKIPKDKVLELASNGIISNAKSVKHNPYRGMTLNEARRQPRFSMEEWEYVQKWGYLTYLQGVNTQLDRLPALVILDDGKILDPKDPKNHIKMTMRGIKAHRGGTIYSLRGHKTFKVGDWIVVQPDGGLNIIPQDVFQSRFRVYTEETRAVCDMFLDNLKNFDVEIFGQSKQKIQEQVVMRWPVIRAI